MLYILQKSVLYALDQAERAQTLGDVAKSQASLERPQTYRIALDDLASTEHLRKEAWTFSFSFPTSEPAHI